MEKHRDNKRFSEWNLQRTAKLLSENNHVPVLVIKPSRMELGTFASFSNYVRCDAMGNPIHEPLHYALLHLQKIIDALLKTLDLSEVNLTLVGFSKGCVVLNQLVHEFHFYSTFSGTETDKIKTSIKRIIWLDGGHCGGKETWITSRGPLETLAKTGLLIYVFLTPYQIRDDRRPWIKKEEKQFSETLRNLGASISRQFLYQEEDPSIENHFKIISVFHLFLNE
ncbi:mitochondrial protein C2orf69 homolog isoform X2 [Artemia franciscana]